ncbi:MAG: hypothetical protein IPK70_06230 [Flavobacteriales bacterium]|nr:hypothetical protein [Flavobacteriales bacterium]
MGNKKGVDILIQKEDGSIQIIEVKGVAAKMDWIVGNNGRLPKAKNLFFALVSYNGMIALLDHVPDFWLVPSEVLARKGGYAISKNGKTVFLRNAHIRANYQKQRNTLAALYE